VHWQSNTQSGRTYHIKEVAVCAGSQGYVNISSINGTENANKQNRETGLQVTSSAAFRYMADLFAADWGLIGGDPLAIACSGATEVAPATPTAYDHTNGHADSYTHRYTYNRTNSDCNTRSCRHRALNCNDSRNACCTRRSHTHPWHWGHLCQSTVCGRDYYLRRPGPVNTGADQGDCQPKPGREFYRCRGLDCAGAAIGAR